MNHYTYLNYSNAISTALSPVNLRVDSFGLDGTPMKLSKFIFLKEPYYEIVDLTKDEFFEILFDYYGKN